MSNGLLMFNLACAMTPFCRAPPMTLQMLEGFAIRHGACLGRGKACLYKFYATLSHVHKWKSLYARARLGSDPR